MAATKADIHTKLEKIASRMVHEIQEMKPRERKLAFNLAREYSETNCWWVLYDLKDLIVKLVGDAEMFEKLSKKCAKKGRR